MYICDVYVCSNLYLLDMENKHLKHKQETSKNKTHVVILSRYRGFKLLISTNLNTLEL